MPLKKDYNSNKWWNDTATKHDYVLYLFITTAVILTILYAIYAFGRVRDNVQEVEQIVEEVSQVEVINVNELSVQEQIEYYAQREGYDPDYVLALASCESSYRPNAVGDAGHSIGLYQINDRWHNLTHEQRTDIEYSTVWTINQLKQGNAHLWTCADKI